MKAVKLTLSPIKIKKNHSHSFLSNENTISTLSVSLYKHSLQFKFYFDALKLTINGIQSAMYGILWKYGTC